MSSIKYKYLIGEAVQVKILDSLIPATVTGKAQFQSEPVYEITFRSGKTATKLEPAIAPDTLVFIREEPPVQVEAVAPAA